MAEQNLTPEEEMTILRNEINNIIDEREEENIPQPTTHYDIMEFFKEVLNLKQPEDVIKISKTGNLKETEIGSLPCSIRKSLLIAQYAKSEGLELVQEYLSSEAIIGLASSLSRKGSLLNAAITNKKVNKQLGPITRQVESGMFGKKTEIISGEEGEGSL